MDRVCIGEEQQFAVRCMVKLITGPVLSQPVGRQRLTADNFETIVGIGQLRKYPAGIVRGIVV